MPEPPRRALKLAVAVALALVTIAVYARAFAAGFITCDDPLYVSENLHVSRGLTTDGLSWAFRTGHASNWHPLTWITHMLDAQAWGLDARGHHVTNVMLHVAASLALLAALDRMTRAFWPSATVAALFALHPTHVESVAWVSERKDVLCAFLMMLTLLAYARYVEQPRRGRYVVVLVLYALGLMAKPMLVTLPFVLLLLDFWPLARTSDGARWRLVREKIPLLALAAISSVATFFVQRASGAVASSESLPLAPRVSNALVAYASYIEKTLWPADLALMYPHARRVELGATAIAVVILAFSSWLAVRERVRRPYLLCGWLWYLGTLVPVIGLVQVGLQSRADRYTYIPSIGLYVAVVWSMRDLLRARVAVNATLAAAVLGALALATWNQVGYWRDTRTLFEHTLAVTRDNPMANQCYGDALLIDGDVEGASAQFREALRLSPDLADAHNNLGTALGAQGRYDEAIEHFHAALRVQPRSAKAHGNLALALSRTGHVDQALVEYETSLRIEPEQFNVQSQLGQLLNSLGRFGDALPHLRQALSIRDDVETRRALAIALIREGHVDEGIAAYRQLLATSPDDLDALNNIAWIRATHADPSRRDGAEAVRLCERAVSLAPEPNAVLLDTLAAAYAEAGRFDDAVEACERAIALARNSGDHESAARFGEHLQLFRDRTPLHMRP